jgi:hypothetical protein
VISEKTILYSLWLIGCGLLFIIPRNKRRLALVAFLFKQAITWFLGLTIVEFGLISYPVRFFAEVNRASFTFEFFLYPIVCGIFNAFYPEKRSRIFQLGYYYVFPTVMTILEVIFGKYTDLINYIHWNWFLTWLTLLVTFFFTRLFCIWFFDGLLKETYKE